MTTRLEPNPMIGRVLLGRYRIVQELARGGMGVVYLARVEGAEGFVTPVVVKLILRELATDERYLQMFAREAKIVATLRDPSIVKVLAFDEEDGDYVMVLEYVRGYHLGQWKKYLRKLGREVPTDIMLQLAIDVLGALHHAHNAKHVDGQSMEIVHRDVSPSNILLDSSDGRGRLLDFGVARMQGGAGSYKTQVKSVVGKLPYLAPELLGGADATPRSDLYACAVVVHETLYGRNVFRAETDPATMYKVMSHKPEPVALKRDDIPDGLDEVLAKALAKDPEDRYRDAGEFQRELRRLQPTPEHEVREALARLLEQDFGPDMAKALGLESLADRDKAWRRLSLVPGDPDAPRDMMSRRSGSHQVPGAAHMPGGMARSGYHTERDLPPVSEPRGTHPVVYIVAILALLVVGGATAMMFWQEGHNRQLQAGTPPIQVVQTPMPAVTEVVAPEPVEPVDERAAAAEGPAPGDEAAQVAAQRPQRKPVRAKAASKQSGPDARALTAAFRRRQSGVHACFASHPAEAAAAGGNIAVEFSIDAAGGVKSAEVMPKSLATSALGSCILGVANKTKFPGQGEPLVFAIPVTARTR